jgi:hypothetical protein
MVTLVRLWQYPKAEAPMLVTLSGMVTLARLQLAKVEFPMLVSVFDRLLNAPVLASGTLMMVVLSLLYSMPSCAE